MGGSQPCQARSLLVHVAWWSYMYVLVAGSGRLMIECIRPTKNQFCVVTSGSSQREREIDFSPAGLGIWRPSG